MGERLGVNFAEKFERIETFWSPRVVAEMNDYQFKLVRIEGEFVWHSHAETDEAFVVLEGELRIDFRDGAVRLGPGEMYVVPRGVEHKPFAEREVRMMLIEPRGVVNTGDGRRGADRGERCVGVEPQDTCVGRRAPGRRIPVSRGVFRRGKNTGWTWFLRPAGTFDVLDRPETGHRVKSKNLTAPYRLRASFR